MQYERKGGDVMRLVILTNNLVLCYSWNNYISNVYKYLEINLKFWRPPCPVCVFSLCIVYF